MWGFFMCILNMEKHFAYVGVLLFGEGIRKELTAVKTKREETWTETSKKVESCPRSMPSQQLLSENLDQERKFIHTISTSWQTTRQYQVAKFL